MLVEPVPDDASSSIVDMLVAGWASMLVEPVSDDASGYIVDMLVEHTQAQEAAGLLQPVLAVHAMEVLLHRATAGRHVPQNCRTPCSLCEAGIETDSK